MDTEDLRHSLPRWTEHLRRYLHHRLGCRRHAADLAQEAGTRLLAAVDRGEVFREPRAWLFRVGHNLAVDEVRRRSPHPLGLEWQALIVDPRTEEEDPEPVYTVGAFERDRSELKPLLTMAMGALSTADRQLLLGRYVGNRSCMDLARADGVSEDAGKVRLHRARRRLAALIERALREPPLRAGAACAVMLGACAPCEVATRGATESAVVTEAAPAANSLRAPSAPVDEMLESARVSRARAIGLRGSARSQQLERAAEAYAAVSAAWPDAHSACAQAAFRRGEILRSLELDAAARGAFLDALDAANAGGGEPWGVRALLELGRAARRGNRRLEAIRSFEQAEQRMNAELRHRNDAREALVELQMELALWEPAAEVAARWERDAESVAEEGRAARLRARALQACGREAEAQAVLTRAAAALAAIAPDDSPEGAAATRVLQELRAVADG
ncbi:MAG: sigma-70 family RNA polymerase sigma factor [Planctomycetota bacterium]|nr:sigma-70 family RNA polymerase sigma factor [Planctomycetota bacterium]